MDERVEFPQLFLYHNRLIKHHLTSDAGVLPIGIIIANMDTDGYGLGMRRLH